MLRLVSIKDVTPIDFSGDDEPEKVLAVVFAGDVGEFAHCEITLRMKDRGDDGIQLRDARGLLQVVVGTLHDELGPPSA